MKNILILLDSPMQSFAVDMPQIFNVCQTQHLPSKSAVIGMIGNAMGLERTDNKAIDMMSKMDFYVLAFGVNGDLNCIEDYQVIGNGYKGEKKDLFGVRNPYGKINNSPIVRKRNYMADSLYFVSITGNDDDLETIKKALINPKRTLFIGKKACIPSDFIFQGIFDSKEEMTKYVEKFIQEKNLKMKRIYEFVMSMEDSNDVDSLPIMDMVNSFDPVVKRRTVRFVKTSNHCCALVKS